MARRNRNPQTSAVASLLAPAAPGYVADPFTGGHDASLPRPLPMWLHAQYAKHIVKGNFMTLSARPKTVEPGEWIAHQAVDHYRLLWNFVRLIHEKDSDGTSICNTTSCPKMSAGRNHSYTWLNGRFEPIELPAREYMSLMQRWIAGKIDDPAIFPTDPATVSYANPTGPISVNSALTSSASLPVGVGAGTSTATRAAPTAPVWIGRRSGFPQDFAGVCRTVFLQMFHVYAHLYWSHYVDPFYHLNLEKQLNSCFSHFVLTAAALDMLRPEDVEPIQLLIDLWAANGTFPPESKAYGFANLESGRRLMRMAEPAT